MLIQYGSKLCPDDSILKDCIQELFIELWQNRSTTEVRSVKAYILRALKYKIYKAQGRRNISPGIDEDMGFEISHEDLLIHSEDDRQKAARLVDSIQQLPPRQREIIYLKLYQQLSYEELSEVMQINYQAARNLFSQAIKSLRQLL